MTADMSYYWEGARERCEDNKWDGKKNKHTSYQGESSTYILNEDTHPYARSEYHTQLAKISCDKIFDLTAGVYFYFYNMIPRTSL